jgi:hypothetical protein
MKSLVAWMNQPNLHASVFLLLLLFVAPSVFDL